MPQPEEQAPFSPQHPAYLQCTMSMTRLLTVGGMPFEAMHR